MKRVKTNRYEQAVKEMKNLDESLVEKIKEEIKETDKDHFHVIMVKVLDRPGQVKNATTVTTQQFNEIAFQKIQKKFQFLGFTNLILLHDPRQNIEAVEEKVLDSSPKKTQEEIDNGGEFICGDSLKELKAFAKENEIDITGLIKKDEIKSALLAWHNTKNEK